MLNDLSPVAVILITSGTRGNRLLFRYPYTQEPRHANKSKRVIGKNPYAIKITENLQDGKKSKVFTSYIKDGVFTGFSNQTIANFLFVKSDLCGKKFSVEIDDVRFVGYPISLLHLTRDTNLQNSMSSTSRQHNILSVNVVFVLRAGVSESVISCYQELTQQMAVAIAHEEKRCQYLTKEAKIMMSAFDEASVTGDDDMVSPLKQIIHHSSLAKELKSVFDSLESSGQALFFMNQWVEINFCLPHKIHAMLNPGRTIQLEAIYRCLSYVRPYHGILLIKSEKELLNFLPLDGSPSLVRLIKLTTPVKNLKTLALETDLSITQIYQLVCHMIYWGFAMLIYPLCQFNRYVISSAADISLNSRLSQEFSMCFPGLQLQKEIFKYSFPSDMLDGKDMMANLNPRYFDKINQVVVWMLQHHVLNQVHTYVNLLPARKKEFPTSFNASHSTMSSTYSSTSSVQVVEESYLSVLLEDPSTSTLDRATSMSDIASVNSEESGGQYTNLLSKSPSQEANSDGSIVPEDMKTQWRIPDSLLNELKPEMKAAIFKCQAAKNPEDLNLFAKLFPYFNGKHHLEEMMFYENLHRSQLVTLLDKFNEVLVLCHHEDPATSLL
ncbi:GATOR complex protein NPRL3-like [Physella acuta]|uniref:GATOR complex protein NPRL3-like n=1 Tax=Physella acuta TaxID=109671 RepID=UPI0027DD8539|nr:GATOR complex protein NPRL3-like [Physella acuta]